MMMLWCFKDICCDVVLRRNFTMCLFCSPQVCICVIWKIFVWCFVPVLKNHSIWEYVFLIFSAASSASCGWHGRFQISKRLRNNNLPTWFGIFLWNRNNGNKRTSFPLVVLVQNLYTVSNWFQDSTSNMRIHLISRDIMITDTIVRTIECIWNKE